ncbi:hypothetical protein [Paenirhodobacter sp.]|uniref:hypothetical protein n=1 Tax=Paenirhodobacter sp. TaxID=1965326 RepID=UPI003B508BB1
MMGFRLRGTEDYVSATWIAADRRPEPQPPGTLRSATAPTGRCGWNGGSNCPQRVWTSRRIR